MYGSYTFRTQGREYTFRLEDDGLIHCGDLNLKAETVEALKPLVVAAVKEEKKIPRIPVILLETRWHNVSTFVYGLASGQPDHQGYRWVSFKDDDGRQRRGKFGKGALYLDTPENRQLTDNIVSTQREINSLKKYVDDIKSQMPKVGDPVEVEVSL